MMIGTTIVKGAVAMRNYSVCAEATVTLRRILRER